MEDYLFFFFVSFFFGLVEILAKDVLRERLSRVLLEEEEEDEGEEEEEWKEDVEEEMEEERERKLGGDG